MAEAELNQLLGANRVLSVHRDFVVSGEHSFWAIAVEYLPKQSDKLPGTGRGGKARIDYREVLSEQDFVLFARLRDWRKKEAAIEGVGDAKLSKYGQAIIAIVQKEGGA